MFIKIIKNLSNNVMSLFFVEPLIICRCIRIENQLKRGGNDFAG